MTPERQERERLLAELLQDIDLNIRTEMAKAKLCRAYYLQLVDEGFHPAEALELCKSFHGYGK
jgi:hypothetical protein